MSIKGSEAYRDFDNVTDGYKFLNSTYVRNDVPAQSLVVTVCDHRAGVTNGKCNNCGAEVAAAAVTTEKKKIRWDKSRKESYPVLPPLPV